MADPLFGHDGRGDFHGVNLVEIDKTKLPFDKILTESSTLISDNLDSPSFGKTILKSSTAPEARGHLGITEAMLEGVPGPKGDQGIQGIQGVKGDKGDKGDTGPQGIQGVKGEPGAIGPAGLNWKGVYSTSTQYDMDDAVSYLGASYFSLGVSVGALPTDTSKWALMAAQGVKGDVGDKGEQGIQGVKGDKGDRGEQGIQGIQGEQGIQGVKGDKGEQGIQGIQGEQGIQGVSGIFDVNSLTDQDLRNLLSKLLPYLPQTYWSYAGVIQTPSLNGSYSFPIGDSGLTIVLNRRTGSSNSLNIKLTNPTIPGTYDIKYMIQSGTSDIRSWYRNDWVGTTTNTEIDNDVRGASTDLHICSVYNKTTDQWYKIFLTISGANNTSTPHNIRVEIVRLNKRDLTS